MKFSYTSLKKMFFLSFFATLILSFPSMLSAQHHEHDKISHKEHHNKHPDSHFRAGIVMAHTYIGTTTIEGEQTIIVPSVGFDIEYWFNHKFGLGFHNDLEIESFVIEENQEEVVEKKYPTLVTFDALWRPWKGFVFLAGFGMEFEKNGNLQVARIGAEYEIEFGNHWDVFPTIFYDSRKDAHNTFSIGLGLGKHF